MKEYNDTQRVDYILRTLHLRGTEGLADRLGWECCTSPTRGHIDHAIHLEEQAQEAKTRLDQLIAQREDIERRIAAMPPL